MTARVVSLCTGYGGLDMAVTSVLDAEVVAHCDIDPAASTLLAHRWSDVPNLHDLRALTWVDYEPDVVTAGYPCQPFSLAGRRKGTDDDRHIWPAILEGVRRTRPGLVVLENVAGHRSMGLDTVLGGLAAIGYDATWTSLRASEVGACHGRERIFIVAVPQDSDGAAGHQWRLAAPGQAQRGRSRSDAGRSGRARAAADAERGGRSGRASDAVGEPVGRAAAAGRRTSGRDGAAAHTARDGRHEGWPESAGLVGRSDVAERGAGLAPDAADRANDGERSRTKSRRRGAAADSERESVRIESVRESECGGEAVAGHVVQWGRYELAVRRWERLTRSSPSPVEWSDQYRKMRDRRRAGLDRRPVGRRGSLGPVWRLNPRFVEWMMGLPAGHVCDVPGLSRNDMLKLLGNGVVPQQAEAALRWLLPIALDVAA